MRGDPVTGSGLWCRTCALPARVEGEPELGKAVHAATGEELGPDGHPCAPVDFLLPSMLEAAAAAREAAARNRAALGFP